VSKKLSNIEKRYFHAPYSAIEESGMMKGVEKDLEERYARAKEQLARANETFDSIIDDVDQVSKEDIEKRSVRAKKQLARANETFDSVIDDVDRYRDDSQKAQDFARAKPGKILELMSSTNSPAEFRAAVLRAAHEAKK
jgi:hypothetical protein